METYTVRISAEYAEDHLEVSSLPGRFVEANGRGVEIMLTLGELHELVTRADYYADPFYGRELIESGRGSLHSSAQKACEQIERQGLWDIGWSDDARRAYSEQWDLTFKVSN